jgi:hypothetical protein
MTVGATARRMASRIIAGRHGRRAEARLPRPDQRSSPPTTEANASVGAPITTMNRPTSATSTNRNASPIAVT